MTTTQGLSEVDVSQMEELKTGDPHLPIIYIDRNCQVFAQMGSGESRMVRHVLTPEIRGSPSGIGFIRCGGRSASPNHPIDKRVFSCLSMSSCSRRA